MHPGTPEVKTDILAFLEPKLFHMPGYCFRIKDLGTEVSRVLITTDAAKLPSTCTMFFAQPETQKIIRTPEP